MEKISYINGFTKSAWKSLAIKSIRIGWVQGLEEAAKNLSKSDMKSLLIGGLFEDVFPTSYQDLEDCNSEIENQEYLKLCQRNTLHGRGYAQQFFDLAEESTTFKGKMQGGDVAKQIIAKTSISWINPRVNNCIYTWYKIRPTNANYHREALNHKWNGMPKNILDGHTFEGKWLKQEVELLSGHYPNHLHIGKRVMKEGWEPIRYEFINSEIKDGKHDPLTLF